MTGPLLTKKQVAGLLQVSVRTVETYCATRILPFVQLPSGKRFDPGAIEAFLKSRTFHQKEA